MTQIHRMPSLYIYESTLPIGMHSNWNLLKSVKFYDYDYGRYENGNIDGVDEKLNKLGRTMTKYALNKFWTLKQFHIVCRIVPIKSWTTNIISVIKSTFGYQICKAQGFQNIFIIYLDLFNLFFFSSSYNGFHSQLSSGFCIECIFKLSSDAYIHFRLKVTHLLLQSFIWITHTLYFITSLCQIITCLVLRVKFLSAPTLLFGYG